MLEGCEFDTPDLYHEQLKLKKKELQSECLAHIEPIRLTKVYKMAHIPLKKLSGF